MTRQTVWLAGWGLGLQTFDEDWEGNEELGDVTESLRYGNDLILNPEPDLTRKVVVFRRDREGQEVIDLGSAGRWKFEYQISSTTQPTDPRFTNGSYGINMRSLWSSRISMSPLGAYLGKGLPMWGIEKALLLTANEAMDPGFKRNLEIAGPIPSTSKPVLHRGDFDTTKIERADLGKTRVAYPFMAVVVSPITKYPLMKFDKNYMKYPEGDSQPSKKMMVEVTLRPLAYTDDTIQGINAMLVG